MKKHIVMPVLLLAILIISSCSESDPFLDSSACYQLKRANYKINVDSMYTYPGDTIYNSWLKSYNARLQSQTRALSLEDDAFFSKQYIVKSTETTLLYGKNYIYPGAILEGNSIIDQKYVPVFVNNRNPITVSMTLTHNTPKHTSQTINSPTYSKLDDYVKDMVVDGNFSQNQKFMFQSKRFSFYDEIKSAFGTNINTRKLFSSRKETSTSEEHKIVKSTGMYVKFFQSSFVVNMDIAPLSNEPVKGKTEFEPVYVSSVTYGRLGIIVFETEETYEFAETCMKKEIDRIFYHKTTTLNEKEQLFFDTTDFKVLIIGADSDYAVQTIKGYGQFLNLIYNSTFTEHSYGVPIACSFSYANSHALVETEFENTLVLQPLFVYIDNKDITNNHAEYTGYSRHSPVYLRFYEDREKTKTGRPYTDIVFEIEKTVNEVRYYTEQKKWPMISSELKNTKERSLVRNIKFDTNLFIGNEIHSYIMDGPEPGGMGQSYYRWEGIQKDCSYNLLDSPFFIKIY